MSSIVVVGDGAVGTAVAVALSAFCEDLILAGPVGTTEKMREFTTEGVICQSATVLHTAIDRISSDALVIVALKAFDIRGAVSFINKFCDGRLICLSNGMGLEKEWGEFAGNVEYSVFTMGFRKTGPSTVQIADGLLYCVENGNTAGLFNDSQMPVQSVVDINDQRWAKWYANSVINPIGALSGLENNMLIKAGLRQVIDELSQEISVMVPSQTALDEGQKILDWLLKNSSNKCSMLQDVEYGSRTEIDFLTGLCITKLPGKCSLASRLVSEIQRLQKK